MMIQMIIGMYLQIGSAWSQSNITDVLVYGDRAEITRTQKGNCSNGFLELQFENIPVGVEQRSIRAVTAQKTSEVVGVTSKTIPGLIVADEISEQLQAKKIELMKQMEIQKTHLSNISSQQTQLGAYEKMFYQVLQEEMRNTKANTSKWKSSLNSFQNTYQNLDKERQTHETELRRLQRELELITKQLNRRGSQTQKSSVRASVRVDCKKQSTSKVLLTYIVPGATWKPEYDFHFDKINTTTDSRKFTLTTSAIIRQSTGENWENAKITLTTAKPNLGSTPPYPRAIVVNGQERTTDKILVEGEENRSSFESGTKSNGNTSHSELNAEGQNYTFTLPSQSQVILSNGQEHWVPLDEQSGQGKVNNIVVPKVSPNVFEGISFPNPAPYALLSGNVNIHNVGSYMGTHSISYTGAGEPVELAISHVPELTIERTTLHDKRKSQILGKSKVIQRAYEIKITNNSKETHSIEIRENIPVSKHEELHVKVGEDTTSGYDHNKKQGFVTWNTDIKPQDTSSFFLFYEVSVPSDWDM